MAGERKGRIQVTVGRVYEIETREKKHETRRLNFLLGKVTEDIYGCQAFFYKLPPDNFNVDFSTQEIIRRSEGVYVMPRIIKECYKEQEIIRELPVEEGKELIRNVADMLQARGLI